MMESRATHPSRPLIIPIFIPHQGCRHHCVFCNQRTLTGRPSKRVPVDWIAAEVKRYLKASKNRPSTVQISFYGGTFLGLERQRMVGLLEAASKFVASGAVDSLRFSTRPDTVSPETLAAIRPFPVSTVELGVQSMNDAVLDASRRGHTVADTVNAAALIKAQDYQLGLQMMVGLPGDDDAGAIRTARRLVGLKPDFVRIYPTLVLAGSPLAEWYRKGTYRPLSLSHCTTLVKHVYLLFRRHGIPVVRMGLQASDGLADGADALLAGPFHPAFGQLVHGEIILDALQTALNAFGGIPDPLTITAHPTIVSRVQGLNRRNLLHLRRVFSLKEIRIVQSERVPRDCLLLYDHPIPLS